MKSLIKGLVSFSLQAKLILLAGISILSIMVFSWYYYTSMKQTNLPLNIVRLQKTDKIYTYSVFSDFYFRIQSFGSDGKLNAEYSEFIPTRTNIGYDFLPTDPQQILRPEESGKPMNVFHKGSSWDPNTTEFIKRLQEFSKRYGEIMAVQNQQYLDEAMTAAMKVQNALYGDEIKLNAKKTDDFFEDSRHVAIENMSLRIYKLNYINANKKSYDVCGQGIWCQDIFRYQFNEKDAIYLQYLSQYKEKRLDDYVKDTIDQGEVKNTIVVRTVKPTPSGIKPIYFFIRPDMNKIESWFMDDNGYTYGLYLKTDSKESLSSSLDDYYKIAYGISFVPIPGFKNTFAYLQNDAYVDGKNFFSSWVNLMKHLEEYKKLGFEKINSSFVRELVLNKVITDEDERILFSNNKLNEFIQAIIAKDKGLCEKNSFIIFGWFSWSVLPLTSAAGSLLCNSSDKSSPGIQFNHISFIRENFGIDPPYKGYIEKLASSEQFFDQYKREIEKAKEIIKKEKCGWLNPTGCFVNPEKWIIENCGDLACVRHSNFTGWH